MRSASIVGVLVFADDEVSPYDILKWADKAMYQAIAAGRSAIRFYEAQDQARCPGRRWFDTMENPVGRSPVT